MSKTRVTSGQTMIPPGHDRGKLRVTRMPLGYSGTNWGFTRTTPGHLAMVNPGLLGGVQIHLCGILVHPGCYHFQS